MMFILWSLSHLGQTWRPEKLMICFDVQVKIPVLYWIWLFNENQSGSNFVSPKRHQYLENYDEIGIFLISKSKFLFLTNFDQFSLFNQSQSGSNFVSPKRYILKFTMIWRISKHLCLWVEGSKETDRKNDKLSLTLALENILSHFDGEQTDTNKNMLTTRGGESSPENHRWSPQSVLVKAYLICEGGTTWEQCTLQTTKRSSSCWNYFSNKVENNHWPGLEWVEFLQIPLKHSVSRALYFLSSEWCILLKSIAYKIAVDFLPKKWLFWHFSAFQ